jgi:hypothetical protein
MIKEAYIRFNVKCDLDDKTAIPKHMTVSVGEPDKNGTIEYSCGAYITANQLKTIYAILYEDNIEVKKRKCDAKKLEYAKNYYKKNKDKFKAYMKKYRVKNKDYYTKYNKEWREAHKSDSKINEIINKGENNG